MSPTAAQEIESDDLFRLFNDCNAIGLEVDRVADDLLNLGISQAAIQEAAESRLRVARLYASTARTSLHVAVNRHAIQVEYRKPVRDLVTGEARPVSTFTKAVGVQEETEARVMLGLSNLLDDFLVEYLRVNEVACGSAISRPAKHETITDVELGSTAHVAEQTESESSRENQGAIEFDPYELATIAGREIRSVISSKLLDVEFEASVISNARELALERIANFPNFLAQAKCDMVVQRYNSDVMNKRPDWYKAMAEMLVRARHVNGSDSYETVNIDGTASKDGHFLCDMVVQRYNSDVMNKLFHEAGKGHALRSRGEFGALLATVRNMEFKWFGRAVIDGQPVHILSVALSRNAGSRIQRDGFPGGRVAQDGFVYIDEISQQTLGIFLRSVKIPIEYGIEEFIQGVFFGKVEIDGKKYLMPLASESIMSFRGPPIIRQSSRYRNYRKFHVESDLRFEPVGSNTQLQQ